MKSADSTGACRIPGASNPNVVGTIDEPKLQPVGPMEWKARLSREYGWDRASDGGG